MSLSKQLKQTILLTSLLVLIGFFGYYLSHHRINNAWADSDDPSLSPLRGWAWTDTIGWISFNCNDTGLCATSPYVVAASDTESPPSSNLFKLQGHAWSDNVGWLTFDTSVYGADCPTPRPCGDCGACYNRATKKITGWAKVLSLNNPIYPEIGWVELGANGNNPGISVTDGNGDINQADWGDLTGWAWNGSNDKSGLGWFNFNCLTGGAGGANICATKNYKVTAQPAKPVITSILPTPGKDSSSIDIHWTPVYGATSYEILRQDYVCSGNPTQRCTKDFDNTCPGMGLCNQLTGITTIDTVGGRSSSAYSDTTNIVEFATYIYYVRAKNVLGGIASLSTPKYSVSPIGVNDFNATGICQAPAASGNGQIFVDLSWTAYYTFNAGSIENYNIEYCTTKTGGACGAADFVALPTITAPSSTSPSQWRHTITDNPGDANDLYSQLKASQFITYRLRGVGRDMVCVGGSGDNHPCTPSTDCGGGTCTQTNTCQGGDNDGNHCAVSADCPNADPTNACGPSKSSWLLTPAKQICPRGTEYKEVRPDN